MGECASCVWVNVHRAHRVSVYVCVVECASCVWVNVPSSILLKMFSSGLRVSAQNVILT